MALSLHDEPTLEDIVENVLEYALEAVNCSHAGVSVEDREVAHTLARHAAVALASAQDTASVWRAIDARRTMGQAQGILMERLSIDADLAFAVLRTYSQDNNVKLHTAAERLVATRKLSG